MSNGLVLAKITRLFPVVVTGALNRMVLLVRLIPLAPVVVIGPFNVVVPVPAD